jgi:hypothetical protein
VIFLPRPVFDLLFCLGPKGPGLVFCVSPARSGVAARAEGNATLLVIYTEFTECVNFAV